MLVLNYIGNTHLSAFFKIKILLEPQSLMLWESASVFEKRRNKYQL